MAAARHWRLQFLGGPLDGQWHEGQGLMPNKIEETIDGVLYIYVIEPDTMTATLEEHVP